MATTIPPAHLQGQSLKKLTSGSVQEEPHEIEIGKERFLATSLELSGSQTTPVRLSVLGSYDQATRFVDRLNRYLLLLGLAAILVGSGLVFFVSHTFTRPLGTWLPASEPLKAETFIIRWIHAGATKLPN